MEIACRVFAVSNLAREMIQHAMQWSSPGSETSRSRIFFQVLADVADELAAEPLETWLPTARSKQLRRAQGYSLDRLAEDISNATVAGIAGLSERTLGRRSRQELGMTFSAFVHRARMIKAMELLAVTDRSITDIGLATGYNSTSSFIKAFRAFSGTAPRHYRSDRTDRM